MSLYYGSISIFTLIGHERSILDKLNQDVSDMINWSSADMGLTVNDKPLDATKKQQHPISMQPSPGRCYTTQLAWNKVTSL